MMIQGAEDLERLSENVHKLMELVEEQRSTIANLNRRVSDAAKELAEAQRRISEAEAKADALLAAHAISGEGVEMKQTGQRLDRMIKEIDRCMALIDTV